MSLCNNLPIFCTISLGYQRVYSSAIKEDGQVITFGGKNINEKTGAGFVGIHGNLGTTK